MTCEDAKVTWNLLQVLCKRGKVVLKDLKRVGKVDQVLCRLVQRPFIRAKALWKVGEVTCRPEKWVHPSVKYLDGFANRFREFAS